MNLDIAFVSVALKEGREAVRYAVEQGIDEDFLQGDGQKAWRFVLEYVKDYSEVPDPGMVEGKTGVKLGDPPPGASAFYTDEVRNRRLHREIRSRVDKIMVPWEKSDPQGAFQEYETGLREMRKMHLATAKTVSLPSLGPEFLDYYEKLKNGYTGILTPWPTINDATLGFWPEDFILYVARLGIGKTWTLVLLANHAWHVQGKRVLFATTEMSQIKILQRWVAVHYKLPYNELRKGRLSIFAEEKMRKGLEEIREQEGLYIIGGDFDFRIESLEAAIEEAEPDIVFVDGAYLLKVAGEGRTEKAANSFDELKRCAKRNGIPLVASTQFNREVKGNKLSSAGAEKIALSDAAGWNADLIFGLVRTEDMKRDRRMIQKPLKFREGEGEDVECWWDFDLMNFDELPGAGAATATGGGGGPLPGAAPSSSGASGPDTDVYSTGLLDFQDDDGSKDGGDPQGPPDVPF
jgi:replicative DNA helicase